MILFPMPKLIPFVFLFIFFLSGCDGKEKEITTIDNPELVAVAFFHALYNEKNTKKAASVCSPKLAKLVLHYRSPQAVARHMFNMSYDKVNIETESSGVKIRKQFKDKTAVTLYFTGSYQDSNLKNVKRVSLIQINGGKWVINKVLKDPF